VRSLARGSLLAGLMTVSYWFAYQLRFDFELPDAHADALRLTILPSLLAKFAICLSLGSHRRSWSHWGASDAWDLVRLVAVNAIAVLALQGVVLNLRNFPRSVFILDAIVSLSVAVAMRWTWQHLRVGSPGARAPVATRPIVLVGAGDTGGQLLGQLARGGRLPYRAEGIVDDDPARQGSFVHGVPVLGTVDDLAQVVEAVGAEEIIVATPSASGEQMRRIVECCREAGRPYRLLPPTEEVLAGSIQWKQVRQVQIEDLLRREPVRIDSGAIAALVAGRCVFVSGAAGSIGSEVVRQLAGWGPAQIVLLDRSESDLFHLQLEFVERWPDIRAAVHIGDAADRILLKHLFKAHRPDVVVHAAAYKHVPMVEHNVIQGVANNVLGTEAIAEAAGAAGCRTVVLISTDKAVNPTSVMGTTKRLAELVMQRAQLRHPKTRFLAVRFGNVLGSQGSVIPLFKDQIARGGPVCVTHPEMRRYFMTIPEAARLVLQAATLGDGGCLYILDMGEPIRIVDLASDLIRLSGLEPGIDIEVKFTGMRPGEKLFEELAFDAERMERTQHKKVFRGRLQGLDVDALDRGMVLLRECVENGDSAQARRLMQELVPEASLSSDPGAQAG
jgi:FlaA1/EpsC-like NDP-sugar epimerase